MAYYMFDTSPFSGPGKAAEFQRQSVVARAKKSGNGRRGCLLTSFDWSTLLFTDTPFLEKSEVRSVQPFAAQVGRSATGHRNVKTRCEDPGGATFRAERCWPKKTAATAACRFGSRSPTEDLVWDWKTYLF